jgi:excinuclease ABC subunit A
MEVIKSADYIIDLGPEGGERGGEVVGYGTPEDLIRIPMSYTGQFLKKKISNFIHLRRRPRALPVDECAKDS